MTTELRQAIMITVCYNKKQTNGVQTEERAGSQMQNFSVLSLHSPDALTIRHPAGKVTHRLLVTRDAHSSFFVSGFHWDFIM